MNQFNPSKLLMKLHPVNPADVSLADELLLSKPPLELVRTIALKIQVP